MADAAARVSGTVLGVADRQGEKNGRAWRMRTATVLVGDDVARVGLPDHVASPIRGEEVDWYVRIRTSGAFLNIDLVSEWKAVDGQ